MVWELRLHHLQRRLQRASAEPPVEDPPSDPSGPYTWEFRKTVAREIGAFLKRSLQGEHRGESGRNKIRALRNRGCIVVKAFRRWSKLFEGEGLVLQERQLGGFSF